MQMKIQVHKSLLVSFLFFFTQEQYERLIRHLHICISVQKTDERQRNEYTCCVWAGGTFFPVVLLCHSFGFWQEKAVGFTYLCTQSTIQLWCCVSFLVLAGNSFWCYVHTQCTIQLCSCVSFLVVVGNSVVAGNSSQNKNTL